MTSDERIEVAARLRKLPSDTYAAIKDWEECGLFVDANLSDEADYSQIYDAVFGVFPAEYMCPGDYKELHERLADLIDPTCHNADDGVRGGFVCSECSYHVEQDTMDADFNAWEDLRHCPNCGARVTSGGER